MQTKHQEDMLIKHSFTKLTHSQMVLK